MGNKVKVLFVVSEFYQAGTERFAFEIDRALNKDTFTVEILCILPLNASQRFSDYYYSKHLELGTKIYFLDEINTLTEPSLLQKIKRRFSSSPMPDERQNIKRFFDQYDCISIMGEYNFKEIYTFLSEENKQKILIHIQNSKYQVKDTYAAFPKDEVFHFVSGFHADQIGYELSEFKNYKHTYYNLNLKFENTYKKTEYNKTKSPKIGIFTRLTSAKPLDPFIYSFQLVFEKIPQAQLHIYGSGNPLIEGVSRYVEQLNLESNVFFRGHQTNILETAVEENLDLIWLHGYHGIPGGWAGFDIATAKIPQLFWNFGSEATTRFLPFFPMYNSMSAFAAKSIEILDDSIFAKKLADEQFEYTNKNYNIENNIHVMETIYLNSKKKID